MSARRALWPEPSTIVPPVMTVALPVVIREIYPAECGENLYAAVGDGSNAFKRGFHNVAWLEVHLWLAAVTDSKW